mgnify:CR=1 FL=1
MRAGQPSVHGQQGGVERFGQGDIERIPAPNRVTELPRPIQQQAVPDALTRPVPKVCDRLPRGCAVQPAAQELPANHPHHLHVNDVRCGLISVEC